MEEQSRRQLLENRRQGLVWEVVGYWDVRMSGLGGRRFGRMMDGGTNEDRVADNQLSAG